MSAFAPHIGEKSGGSTRSGSKRIKDVPVLPPLQIAEAGSSTPRKVRTVPPSAAFEPTTPPSPARPSNDSTLVDPLHRDEKKRERRRPKLRYSTSESSCDDTDGSGSDDEPPWWTFTQRGMNKMKLRSLKQQDGGLPTDDSGREKEGRSRPKKPFKRSSGSGNRMDSSHTPHKKKAESHEPTPRSSVKNMMLTDSPKPIKPMALPPNMRMISTPAFLRSRKETGSGTSTPTVKIKMKRRYSAPSSPVPDEPIQSIAMIASTAEGPAQPVALHGSLPIPPPAGHSLLSIPRPPFMKRHSESLTDTEAVAPQSVRLKSKRSVQTPNEDSGTSTPMRRPNVRKQTMNKLKMNLPDHVTQHFAHGWPHAGSWQDALNGNYDEVAKESSGASRRSSKDAKRQSSYPTSQSPRATAPMATPRMDNGSDSASAPATPPVRRYKPKRRKYRPAIAPPTPSGLGFTAAEKGHGRHSESWKQGRVVEEGFDWGNGTGGNGNGHGHDRITEEGDLTMNRTETNEKLGNVNAKLGEKVKSKVKRNDGMTWKQRLRHKLFLDARVTIWIRFINLAVVVCSLALAITIRNELFQLQLPGLVGPSTTLIIAYSCLTIVHIFIAVYREYFGRPIGLWGLRSKMLWVCLDLLFVALWSSGLTLQINDLIDTPLDCVSQSAWWQEGRSADYARLLDDLDLLRVKDANLADVGISDTLGIILPDAITGSALARETCRRQEGGIALALMTLLLYGGNMVLSLFRIFETVRRTTAHNDRAVMF